MTTKPDIQRMLAETCELEGLLLLAQQRGDETPEYVMTAISEKIERIAAGFSVEEKPEEIEEERSETRYFYSEPAMRTDDAHMAGPEAETADEPDVNDEPAPSDIPSQAEPADSEPLSATTVEEVLEDIRGQQSETEVAGQPLEVLEAEELTDGPQDASVAENIVIGGVADAYAGQLSKETAEEICNETAGEAVASEAATTGVATPAAETIRLDERLQRNCSKDLHSAFSLNDKFRFSRELFGNSTAEMTDAVNLVEAMNSYDEAEDYFYGDLGWNRESDEVKEFMDVIRKHFLN